MRSAIEKIEQVRDLLVAAVDRIGPLEGAGTDEGIGALFVRIVAHGVGCVGLALPFMHRW